MTGQATVERELALMKINAPIQRRPEIMALVDSFEARILDAGINTMVLELAGPPAKVDTFIEAVRPFGIKEAMRSGTIAMVRGASEQVALREA